MLISLPSSLSKSSRSRSFNKKLNSFIKEPFSKLREITEFRICVAYFAGSFTKIISFYVFLHLVIWMQFF